MNNIRTVSDTKRAFYSIHTRPINSVYRRVIEELMVEMHLLKVNVDFSYDPIYALGVVTAFDRFMQGYLPERDKESIFQALIKGQEDDPQKYRTDAKQVCELVQGTSIQNFLQLAEQASHGAVDSPLQSYFRSIATNPKFKYNRPFAIGLYTLIEQTDVEILNDKDNREQTIETLASSLNLSKDKLLKDLDLYRSNLEKVAQARTMMEELAQAERKKQEQRAAKAAEASSETTQQSPSDS
ncbi:MAG: photosystem II biogenesis protein Psp29 [Microcoleaceae cyanobacterium]